MQESQQAFDVVVVGGGPVGVVAAAAAARQGASVLVLEADGRASQRFAGEWLHPTGVGVLDRLRLGRLEQAGARAGYGFVVFPDDGSEPIELPYPDGQTALTCDHDAMVRGLRGQAQQLEGVQVREGARVLSIDDHVVRFRTEDGEHEVRAGRVLGADGRAGLTRKAVDLPARGPAVSYMASVELTDVELPNEGYGHVFLGGPGPVLMYRIGADRVRGCFDVPLHFGPEQRNESFLWDAFGGVLPESLRDRFRAALEQGPVLWATNRFAPRASYGKGALWLTGDAVGHYHPLTAAGLSMGFLDAEQAAESPTLEHYTGQREASSYVPELLSNALYHVFSRDDASAESIRSAVYRVWRRSSFERARTMRILMGAEERRRSFGAAFVRIALQALGGTLSDLLAAGRWRELPRALSAYREWVQWPAASFTPGVSRRTFRPHSTSEQPIPGLNLGKSDERVPAVPVSQIQNDNAASTPEALHAALRTGGDALLGELRGLLDRIGHEPIWAVVRKACRIMVAIDSAELGDPMAARMKLGRRPLARQGFGKLLDARGADPTAVRCTDFAHLILAVLTVDADEQEPAQLKEGLAHILRCQQTSGAFTVWPVASAEPDLHTTAMVCRALAQYRVRLADRYDLAVDDALARALTWLRTGQHADGHFAANDRFGALSNTALGLQAMVACGAGPADPAVKRSVAWLLGRQRAAGCFTDDVREAGPEATARVMTAVLSARAPAWASMEQAAARLTTVLRDELATEIESGAEGEAWDHACEVLEALALYESRSQERPVLPEPKRRGDAKESDHWAYCKQSLEQVSRTFSKPIAMLPGDLEVAVTCGYLLCRIADTVEDHPDVPRDKKDMLFQRLLDVTERGAPPRHFSDEFQDIEGKDPEDVELSLARQLPRVMRVFWRLPRTTQEIVLRWVSEMARGMNVYTRREPGEDGFVALHTADDLTRYCYFVAGTVGHMLTELFGEALGDDLTPEARAVLRRHAEGFGCGLQLVNILKDVTDDRERRWSFVPRSSCADAGTDIETLVDPQKRAEAHAAVAPLFDIARAQLDSALTYSLAIPPQHTGVRLFCLLPLWMAALTLVHGRGNDAMFTAGQEVKISRAAVAQVIEECARHAGDDETLRKRFVELWQPTAESTPEQPQL